MNTQSARHFVNRLEELETIKRSVAESRPGAAAQESVTNHYGVPDIGKSALLADVYRFYEQELALLTLAAERMLRDNLPSQYTPKHSLSQAYISRDSANQG